MTDVRKIRRQTTQYPDSAMMPIDGFGTTTYLQVRDYDSVLKHGVPLTKQIQIHNETGTPEEVYVLCATVPARGEFRDKLLECLGGQSVRWEAILVFDGFGKTVNQNHNHNFTTSQHGGYAKLTNPAQGAGYRWRYVEELVGKKKISPNAIIVNIDDDMIPTPYFVESSVRALSGTNFAGAWAGRTKRQPGWHPLNAPQGGELGVICTYACMVRARHVVGISSYPESDILLGIQGDDELLLSAHLARQGVQMIRPEGHAQVFCGPAQVDAVAQHKNPRTREVQRIRDMLYNDITQLGKTLG